MSGLHRPELRRLGLLLVLMLAAVTVGPALAAPRPAPAWQQLDPALAGLLDVIGNAQAKVTGRAPGLVRDGSALVLPAPDTLGLPTG